MAPPPMTPGSKVSARPCRGATTSSTAVASAVTSGPMPSPGKTAMVARRLTGSRAHLRPLLAILPPVLELVERVHVRQRARLDDVGVAPLPGHGLAVLPHQTRDLALRVGAAGDRLDHVALELGVLSGQVADRLVASVDHAVTSSVPHVLVAVDAELHGGMGDRHAGGGDVQVHQLVAVTDTAHGLLGDQG